MGKLFVVSGPSGSGKTTIVKRLLERVEGLIFSISYTTRRPRPGEEDGIDYFFVDRDRFMELVDEGEVVEWAEVHGELYGTSRSFIEKSLKKGLDVVLDIDTQGAKTLMKKGFFPITIFILPPSWEELVRRVKERGTEDEESLSIRLENARKEIGDLVFYKYLVVNEDLENAVDELKYIIKSERNMLGGEKLREVVRAWQG